MHHRPKYRSFIYNHIIMSIKLRLPEIKLKLQYCDQTKFWSNCSHGLRSYVEEWDSMLTAPPPPPTVYRIYKLTWTVLLGELWPRAICI